MDVSSRIENFKKDPAVRKIVMNHSQVSLPRQLLGLSIDWAMILAAAAVSIYAAHPLVYIASVCLIACRQHAILVYMHEASHYRLSKNILLNDWISDVFAAYPTMLATIDYRKNHLTHHKNTNTDQDPDWARKIPLKEWQYPQTKASILKTFAKQVVVGGYQWLALMILLSKNNTPKKIYWAGVLVAVTAFGVWPEFLLYWMVPLLTLFPLIQRIRSVAEHFGLSHTHELNGSRNILAGPIESFLFSPHNVNYHLAHHLFPGVPQYNLPELHRDLMQIEVYAELAHNNDSFFVSKNSVFHDLQTNGSKEISKAAA